MATTSKQFIPLIIIACLISACGGGSSGSLSAPQTQSAQTSDITETNTRSESEGSTEEDDANKESGNETGNENESSHNASVTFPGHNTQAPPEYSASRNYEGRTDSAPLNTNSTVRILNDLFSKAILTQLEPFAKEKPNTPFSSHLTFYQQLSSHVNNNSSLQGNKFTVDHTFVCDSGSFQLRGELNSNAIGNVDVEFNQCRFKNLTLDGGNARYSIQSFDTSLQRPVQSSTHYDNVQGTFNATNIILNGEEYFEYNTSFANSIKTRTFDLAIHQLNSQTTIWFNNFSTQTNVNLLEQTVEKNLSGRIYHSELGRFNIKTLNPFLGNYHNGEMLPPYTSGQIRLNGAEDSKIEIRTNVNHVVVRVLEGDDNLISESSLGYGKFKLP